MVTVDFLRDHRTLEDSDQEDTKPPEFSAAHRIWHHHRTFVSPLESYTYIF